MKEEGKKEIKNRKKENGRQQESVLQPIGNNDQALSAKEHTNM
jgi:hypothetical protein